MSLNSWKPIIEAGSNAELGQLVTAMGPTTLSRARGVRTNPTTELWIIQKYLSIRMVASTLEFPLVLHSGDRPDFRLDQAGEVTGFEVTTATYPATEIARQQAYELDLPTYSLSAVARSISTVATRADEIRYHLLDQKAHNPGYRGSEVEVELFALLDQAILKKLDALNKTGFERFPLNHLLIYENTGLPMIHWSDLDVQQLRQRNTDFCGIRFDRITILSNGELIEVV